MKNLLTSRVVVAGSLAAILFAAFALTTAFSAPVVVIPGEGAGYIYYSASSGAGAAATPAEDPTLIGQISAFIKLPLPENWVECNGDVVPSQYPELIAYLGGPGARTPDLRGEFLRGFDAGRGVDPDGGARTVGSTQSDMLKSHSHSYTDPTIGSYPMRSDADGWSKEYPTGNAGTTVATGGAETRPRNIAVIYAMRAK